MHVHRECVPIRPVISHEAMHYIDVPDYEALGRKFDEFIAKADPEYLKAAPHSSVCHQLDESNMDDPEQWAVTWRAYRKKYQ